MTFIPDRVHSIPIDVTKSVYMIPGRNFVPYKSFWNEFVPVFNPNEILVLEWHSTQASCKPHPEMKLQTVGEHSLILERENVMAFSVLAQRSSPMVTLLVKIADVAINKHSSISRVRVNVLYGISRSLFSCKYSTNFILERNSFWYHAP